MKHIIRITSNNFRNYCKNETRSLSFNEVCDKVLIETRAILFYEFDINTKYQKVDDGSGCFEISWDQKEGDYALLKSAYYKRHESFEKEILPELTVLFEEVDERNT